MARTARSDFEGAVHHAYGRGNNRQIIFRDDHDYRIYLQRLLNFKTEMGLKILAYCPMPNHYHLATKTGDGALENFMQRLNTSYTRLFNDRWLTVGHLFQGRYGSRRCKTDAEVKAAIRYVHLNPVQDGLVSKPEDWPWSGHRGILAGRDPIIDVAEVLNLFGGPTEYLAFLNMPLKKDSRRDLSALLSDYSGPDAQLLLGPSRSGEAGRLRRQFIVSAINQGHRRSAIAKFIGRSPSAITQLLDLS